MTLLTTDHRKLAVGYLLLSLLAVVIGTVMSLVMRVHLVWPQAAIKPEDYLALVTLHGTLMLFFVLTLAPQAGFGNLIVPAQIGSARMAFPHLNAGAFWLMLAALLTLLSSTLVQGGAAISGWTAYPPLSAVAAAGPGQGLGMDLWLTSIGLFAVSSTLSSINLLATITTLRCPGMTWGRLPLTVWAWFTAALLSVIAFSVLLAALLLLALDRHAGTSFYLPAGRPGQRNHAYRRQRQPAALAASVLVLRSSGGLHRHSAGHGPYLDAARQLLSPTHFRLRPDDRDDPC